MEAEEIQSSLLQPCFCRRLQHFCIPSRGHRLCRCRPPQQLILGGCAHGDKGLLLLLNLGGLLSQPDDCMSHLTAQLRSKFLTLNYLLCEFYMPFQMW